MSHYTERPIANPMDFGDYVRTFPKGRIPGGGNMAMRREVFTQIGIFNTSLGRTGKSLIGGEESDLFERIDKAGMSCYYTPRAVMYHIIPSQKLCDSYFERLCYNTGISQLTRAKIHNRTLRLYIGEVAKWFATLLLCLLHTPVQSKYLIKMRRNISKAIFGKHDNSSI
jgi:GT2 family glycosyltransferase